MDSMQQTLNKYELLPFFIILSVRGVFLDEKRKIQNVFSLTSFMIHTYPHTPGKGTR